MKPMSKKQTEAFISRVFSKRCNGIQIPMMKVGEVYRAGEQALKDGKDEQGVGDALFHAAQAVRAN